MIKAPALVLCLVVAAAADRPTAAPPAGAVQAITAPSEDLTLSFTRSGRIAKLLVREGQRVQPDRKLVQLDDAVERMRLSMLKAKAENTTAVKAAEIRHARSEGILKKVQKAYDDKAAPERELDDARIEAAMAELDLQLARFAHEQNKGSYEEAKLLLDRMRLVSPVAGEVERIHVRAGESVDALAAVIRLVRVDPLWIDVPAGIDLARKLQAGRQARVLLPGAAAAALGRVVRISRIADAASKTLEVRVELPNPTGRPAGEQVWVSFPAAHAPAPKPPPAKPNAK